MKQSKQHIFFAIMGLALVYFLFKDKLMQVLGMPTGASSSPAIMTASMGGSQAMQTISQGDDFYAAGGSYPMSNGYDQRATVQATGDNLVADTRLQRPAIEQVPVNDRELVMYLRSYAMQPAFGNLNALTSKVLSVKDSVNYNNQAGHPLWRYARLDRENKPGFSNTQLMADIQRYQRIIFMPEEEK